MKQERAMEFPKLYSTLESAKAGNEEDEDGEIFGVILSRSRSVSFASTLALRAEKHNYALENAVKRAFSLRRSSSVSGDITKYFTTVILLVDNEMHVAKKSRKKRGKIFEACRRLIRF
ncbi:hypothetical protein CRYUN_Cryun35bG0090700 [Craigia yunnanensis]